MGKLDGSFSRKRQYLLTMLALWIIWLCIVNYVRLLLAVGHSNKSIIIILHAFTSRSTEQCKLLQKNVWVIVKLNFFFQSRTSIYVVNRRVSERNDSHDRCLALLRRFDSVVRFLLHILNIVLSCTLDTNSPSRFSKGATKPASHQFSWQDLMKIWANTRGKFVRQRTIRQGTTKY